MQRALKNVIGYKKKYINLNLYNPYLNILYFFTYKYNIFKSKLRFRWTNIKWNIIMFIHPWFWDYIYILYLYILYFDVKVIILYIFLLLKIY